MNSTDRPDQLLTVAQLAALLGVSRRMAFAILAEGSLPVVRLGRRTRRVRLADVVAWIEARRN